MSFTAHLQDFWQQVRYVWVEGLYGVDISKLIIALGIIFAFLIIRGVFTKYVLYRLHKFAAHSETRLDDKIITALDPPIRFIPLIMGVYFAGGYLDLDENVSAIFQQFIRSLIAFTIFWGLFRTMEPVSHALPRLERILGKAMVDWIFKAMRVLVVFLGGAVILEMWGIRIGPLLAGLGLLGAAVALGAQDMFKNLLGGLTIIIEKRFHPGEWIQVDGVVEGTVEKIGFRSTQIRRFDKAPVHVPNSHLSDTAVTNFSRMTHRRIYWLIGVEYRTTTKQLQTIRDGIVKYLEDNKDIYDLDVTNFVRVDSFNNSSIDILIYCFTKTTVWGEWLEIKENLAFAIKDIVENKAKTGFAFPSQSIYVEQWPEAGEQDKPEIFKEPKEKKAKK